MESPDVNEMAKLSPRVELKGRKQKSDKKENGNDHEGKNEEESSEDNEKEDTEKEDVFSKTLEISHDLSIVQEATTGNYCKKCKKAFKNKKELRRQLITAHVTVRKLASEVCKNVFKTWTDLRGHACKIHENSKDDHDEQERGQ